MNRRQLEKLGVPARCLKEAIAAVQSAATDGGLRGKDVRAQLLAVVERPTEFTSDPHFAPLANALLEAEATGMMEPITYRTWGTEIDDGAHQQMRQACGLPMARGAALMPDAHIGYGLPIGGVLALEGAVVPYAVGVDIACRMKLSIFDLSPEALTRQPSLFDAALERGTRFGIGVEYRRPMEHPVMDRDWTVTRITRENRDKAWRQLGTSGSGNHFVEFGVFTLDAPAPELQLAPGKYVALLSHSGSRGTGASVCSTYSAIAQSRLDSRYKDFGRLAWLDLASEAGQEYWAAMNLMGDYAAANHAVIHQQVAKLLGAEPVAGVENHHNFAWLEEHGGRELVVHRKGATPAGAGVLGVIPGSMADPAFIVRGKGHPESFDSASHGAGRRMSRTQANNTYNFRAVQKDLEKRGVRVLSAGADEVPFVYKNIEEVMAAQADLVETVARFDPRIVKMCGDRSRAED
ncbi:MAG: RtcB family protein [Planctomycetia bacterium]|nr:RtcB family protein [Planctomycetia bacterium]